METVPKGSVPTEVILSIPVPPESFARTSIEVGAELVMGLLIWQVSFIAVIALSSCRISSVSAISGGWYRRRGVLLRRLW